jgi:hypothetical protein
MPGFPIAGAIAHNFHQKFAVNTKTKASKKRMRTYTEEQVRLELINLAVLFRSRMIGREEFAIQAKSLGVTEPVEHILERLPLPALG